MDIKLNYIEKGQGRPFVLLHGNGESSEYFIHQIEYFSKCYRVIAVDTRGHGKSPRGDRPFALDQFVDDLHGFLDEMGIAKATILGFSDGGNIALLFALKHPNYVEKLILNAANLNPRGMKIGVRISVCLEYGLQSFISLFNKKAGSKREILALMVNQPDIKGTDLLKIGVPTLVIAGDRDMIKDEHTRYIHKQLRYGKLNIIEGDHFVANKNSQLFNQKIEEFLGST